MQLSQLLKQSHQNKHQLTFINNNIILLGRSTLFQSIISLYLSKNLIQSLEGIEQFKYLKNFTQIKEFNNCPESIVNLSVQGNPITLNPNYEMQLIQMLPNLSQLDNIRLTPPKRQQADYVCSRMENLGYLLFITLQCMNMQKFSLPPSIAEHHQIILDILTSAQPYLSILQGVLGELDKIFTEENLNNKEYHQLSHIEFINQVLHIMKDKINQISLATYIFQSTSSFMKDIFDDNSLAQYYANVIIQEIEIDNFLDDQNYFKELMILSFAPPDTKFPVFIYNTKYMLGIMQTLINVSQIESTILLMDRNIYPELEDQIQTQKPICSTQFQIESQIDQSQKLEKQTIQKSINYQIGQDQNYTKATVTTPFFNEEMDQKDKDYVNHYIKQSIEINKKIFKQNKAINNISLIIPQLLLRKGLHMLKQYSLNQKRQRIQAIQTINNIINKKISILLHSSLQLIKANQLIQVIRRINNNFFLIKGFQKLIQYSKWFQKKQFESERLYRKKLLKRSLKGFITFHRNYKKLLQFPLLFLKIRGLRRESFKILIMEGLMHPYKNNTKNKKWEIQKCKSLFYYGGVGHQNCSSCGFDL